MAENEKVEVSNEEKTQEPQEITKLKKKLEDCTIVLDPKKSGMFVDDVNQINLNFFDDGKDRFVFTSNMDPTPILRNIKYGILRVHKKGEDITSEFGGPTQSIDWHRKSVVDDANKEFNGKNKQDVTLKNFLNRNKTDEIIRNINTINEYQVLERLQELEESGENPSMASRADVLNAILERMKQVSGIGAIKEEKSEVITVKSSKVR